MGRFATHRVTTLALYTFSRLDVLGRARLALGPLEQKVEHFGFLKEGEGLGGRGLLVEGTVDLQGGLGRVKAVRGGERRDEKGRDRGRGRRGGDKGQTRTGRKGELEG